MKLQCNRERRGVEGSRMYQRACSAHTSPSTHTHTHTHRHTHSALLTMLCWWTSRGTVSREVRLLPNVRLKERREKKKSRRKKKKAVGLRRRAGDGIKHKPTHTNTQSSGGMWCHFTHSAMSVNQFITFFFYQSLQAAVCVISVQSAWIRIMLAFSFCSGCSEREKQEGRREKKGKGRKKKEHCCRVVGWLWCSYFSSQLQTKGISSS